MSPLARKSERLEKRGEGLGAKQETTTSRMDGRRALTARPDWCNTVAMALGGWNVLVRHTYK